MKTTHFLPAITSGYVAPLREHPKPPTIAEAGLGNEGARNVLPYPCPVAFDSDCHAADMPNNANTKYRQRSTLHVSARLPQ